jgi:chemotaxis protein histidine kinase CheA
MGVHESMTETASPVSLSRFLIVTLGGRHLALDAESVGGLLTLDECGNIEDPTIHGMTYRAINLVDWLDIRNDQDGPNAHVVLLSERDARGSVQVTRVEGLLELQQSQVLPLPMQFRGPERHWYDGMILFAQSIALVLNTTWILHEHTSGSRGQGNTLRCATDPKISVNNSRGC